jgi:pSer/pThr/pTyr-binding forkhead associated (FHA) protein
MAFLIFLSGELKGRKFEIADAKITVGRSSSNTIALNEPSVSGKHCEISRDNENYILTDLESTNGTFVNGEQLTGSIQLSPKSTLHFGDIEVIFDAPELVKVGSNAGAASTTGIFVKPGATIRQVPTGASVMFTTPKDTRWVWYATIGGVIITALIALVWFIVALITD